MAVLSPKRSSTSACHVRSISLPPGSHPAILKTFEALKRGEIWFGMRVDLIWNCGSEEMFEAVKGLLDLTSTQRVVSFNRSKRVFDKVLDASVWLLDSCVTTRGVVSHIKEHCWRVRSPNRRSNPDPNFMRMALSFHAGLKKESKKDVRRAVARLKRTENKFAAKESRSQAMDNECNPLFAELREV